MVEAKRLYILRHAKSDILDGVDDQDRPLSEQGRRDARALANIAEQKGYKPDFVLCSPARRTMQTFEAYSAKWEDDIPSMHDEKLYLASAGQLYEFIKNIGDQYKSALIVAHNPGIHELVHFLIKDAEQNAAENIAYGYQPGTLCVFDCPVSSWKDIQPAQNFLADSIIGSA